MGLMTMTTSWTFIIILTTLMTYEDKKNKVNFTSKRSYLYIASDAILRIILLSIVMKVTMELIMNIFN